MRIDVLTLFPEMFPGVLGSSILKRAADPALNADLPGTSLVSYHLTDIRNYTTDKHQKVDNSPFGGGPGMVMQCQPVWDAVQAVLAQQPELPATKILLTPQGVPLTQRLVEELALKPRLLLIAGHYEGIDERVVQKLEPLLEISVGDYVLSGGELPAMVLIDAIVRLIPGVLGHDDSAHHDSFSPGTARLLDHPHYTRPRVWEGMAAPDVLLSGDHAAVDAWRKEQSLARTRARRPDLLSADAQTPQTVRDRCVAAALAAYEDAKVRGLCHEGAWEFAINAVRDLFKEADHLLPQRPGRDRKD